ncbi:MAG: Asp23/Gls24 family envelope stress response protein [Brevibacterium sp.]|uniref:Asp23/Gls24 family envelope stress response protein n=1 Tax=unclassified Brevibacterium TaxID=2614124 RepID=UPI001E48F45B|nr:MULTISPECIES: Asp23/Gls24 family envelope stress response protein [unclassified Brevibacterium]MCD1286686.1 Asp23/Gls24 family envelope stress response protein [Brevibacterium sp. CCUG 69071]MDK8434083.1 Asp23/Gls24 family envelope stress response protein [Brevibacterium sp. H-BE7]
MPEAQQTTKTQPTTADDVRSPLVTDMGNTTIAENVVAKLTGIAAREVPGVYGMGNAARRAFDTLTDRIPGSQTNVSGGVSVEKGEKQTAIDLTIVVEYGTSIVDVAEAIRRNVIRAVEQGTGLQVVEVNIDVTDVHLPEEDDDQPASDAPELN